jgi:hypothetical protein
MGEPEMRIFDFEPADYSQRYADQEWIHVKGGIAPEFLDYLRAFVASRLAAAKLESFAIKGKKEQALFEFPPEADFPSEIFDVAAAVCGLRRETMTLSERHIQIYEDDADPEPVAHKDRYPSQVSIGFSIDIPRQSRLVLYPYDHRETNPFNSAAALQRQLQPYEQPEVVLRDARPVELADEPGDVVMFRGSNTWHLRRNSANAVNLYVKLNDFDCDPLGEDPSTLERRERTLELIGRRDPDQLAGATPRISRRLNYLGSQLARQDAPETFHASLYGSDPVGINGVQQAVLRSADGGRTLGSIVDELAAANGHSRETISRDALTLLERGILDFT